MCGKLIYILVSYMIYAEGSPAYDTVVDQSQSGDVNVEVSLKNVEIIAVLNGGREQYTDYDYNYDYTEMTIKPPNKTSTVSPLNETSSNSSDSTLQPHTTVKPDESTLTLTSSEDTQGSSTVAVMSVIPSLNPASSSQSNLETSSNPTSAATVASTDGLKIDANAATSSAAIEESTEAAQKECRKGFHRNKKGECELKLKPSSTNALLKLVELSQKLKLRRAN